MMKSFCLLLCALGSLLPIQSGTSSPVAASQTVDASQIEVRLVPDKAAIMLGEPAYFSFIVRNNSDQDLQVTVGGDYRNRLGRPETFQVLVTNQDGKEVPQPDAGPGFGGLTGPQKLPANGHYSFQLFLPHWALIEGPGRYTIVAKRTLQLSRWGSKLWHSRDQTTNLDVQAYAAIEVTSEDTEQMEALIASLGAEMLGTNHQKAGSSAQMLSNIRDERVIPWFVRALATNNSEKKVTALQALSKFNNDSAFQALKSGMETQGEDIANTTTREVADQSAENVRNTAAASLATNSHPEAIPFLLSKRKDPTVGVRITVLHVVGKMKPEDAIPILEEMTNDQNKMVSDEAKRYLKEARGK